MAGFHPRTLFNRSSKRCPKLPTDNAPRVMWETWCKDVIRQLSSNVEWLPLLWELRGIADGAEVTLEQVVMLNARHELAAWERVMRNDEVGRPGCLRPMEDFFILSEDPKPTEDCNILSEYADTSTSAYFSDAVTNNHPVVAQSWNMPSTRTVEEPEKRDRDVVVPKDHAVILLKVTPCRQDGPAAVPHFIVTKPGVLMKSGMNQHGYSVVVDSVFSTRDRDLAPSDLPMTLLARKMLTSCVSLACTTNVLQRYRIGSTHSLLHACRGLRSLNDDTTSASILELLPHTPEAGSLRGRRVLPDANLSYCLVHTNHLIAPQLAPFQLEELVKRVSLPAGLLEVAKHSKKNLQSMAQIVRRYLVQLLTRRFVNFVFRAWDSPARFNRLRQLIEFGDHPINQESILNIFSDHIGEMSVCQHTKADMFKELSEVSGELDKPWSRPQGNHTACLVTYHLEELKITVSTGPPCHGNHLVFQLLDPSHLDEVPTVAAAVPEDRKFKWPQKPKQTKPPQKRHLLSAVDPPILSKRLILGEASNPNTQFKLTCASWWGVRRMSLQRQRALRGRKRAAAICSAWNDEWERQGEVRVQPERPVFGPETKACYEERKRRFEQEYRRLCGFWLLKARWQTPGRPDDKIVGDRSWPDHEVIGTPPRAEGAEKSRSPRTDEEEAEMVNHFVETRARFFDSAAARFGTMNWDRWKLANGLMPRGSSMLRNVETWTDIDNDVLETTVVVRNNHCLLNGTDYAAERAFAVRYDERTGHRHYMRWGLKWLRDIAPPRVIDERDTQRAKFLERKRKHQMRWQEKQEPPKRARAWRERLEKEAAEEKAREEGKERARKRAMYQERWKEQAEEKKRREEEAKRYPPWTTVSVGRKDKKRVRKRTVKYSK